MRFRTFGRLALTTLVLAIAGCDQITPVPPRAIEPDDRYPAWSPDGRRIAYFHEEKHDDPAEDDPMYPTGLYVVDLETGERHLVVEGYELTPDWSPDGQRLAFAAGDIFTVRADGSDLRQVTTHGDAFFPRYSPSGNTLTYGRSGTHDEAGLWFAFR